MQEAHPACPRDPTPIPPHTAPELCSRPSKGLEELGVDCDQDSPDYGPWPSGRSFRTRVRELGRICRSDTLPDRCPRRSQKWTGARASPGGSRAPGTAKGRLGRKGSLGGIIFSNRSLCWLGPRLTLTGASKQVFARRRREARGPCLELRRLQKSKAKSPRRAASGAFTALGSGALELPEATCPPLSLRLSYRQP